MWTLDAADRCLQGDQPDHHGEWSQRSPVAAPAGEDEPDRHRGDPEDRRHDRVALDHPLERVGALEVEPLDELAVVVAGMRPRGGADRAGENRQLAERDQRPDGPDAEAVGRAAALVGLVARAPHEREGGVEQQHREDEVTHHQAGSQVVLDDEGAEGRLSEDAERQERAEQGEVPAVGAAAERQRTGGDDHQPDEPGDEPVAVLDDGVEIGGRDGPSVALRPVRAAES